MSCQDFDRERNRLHTEIAILLGLPRCEIRPEASLQRDLGIDSLDTVELVEALEQDFHVHVQDDDFSMIDTIADLERFVVGCGGD